MVDDNERQDIARWLRKEANRLGPYLDFDQFAVYTADAIETEECSTWYQTMLRLADLIEPSTQCPLYHSDKHYCSIYEEVHVIDRYALLSLAEQMDNFKGAPNVPHRMRKYARIIREALNCTTVNTDSDSAAEKVNHKK